MSSVRMYDHLPAGTAIRLAWTNPGPDPQYHEAMKKRVRKDMPVLARALDRAEKESKQR